MAVNSVARAVICSAAIFAAAASSLALADAPPKNPQEIYGPRVQPATKDVFRYMARRRSSASVDALRYWNQLAVDATGLDHTPVAPGEDRVYGEQLGPTRSSRAMAIVHVSMFEAVNSILGGYRSYAGLPRTREPASVDAAIATSAHDTLSALFPSQKQNFDVLYAQDLNRIPLKDTAMKDRGVVVGHLAAAVILALRVGDGSAVPDPKLGSGWVTSNEPGHWRQDPIALSPIALGAYWGEVKPFVIRSATEFLAPPPPALTSPEYTAAYDEVKSLGGDGIHTPTQRTAEQTYIGIYWAYDGTPSLCAPPRLYNEIATEISKSSSSVGDMARLFALVNVAMADAAISVWKSKYFYDLWRPVTGIRESDGNPQTQADPTFWPLGAPASNLTGVNFTPPFPSYPSGHAGFGGALFEILRRFYGTDRIAFSFTSDEFDGETRGNDGKVRPLEPRSFSSLSQAEEENGQSRIYLGIHWQFDKTEGITMGQRVADYVFDNAFQTERRDH